VLADIKVNSTDPKVLMHANPNGFFYVLDHQRRWRLAAAGL
jgi:glucose dehydrogenase